MNLHNDVTQKFGRYEFKYLLSQKECDRLESEVRNFMRYDGHVDEGNENRYLVRSLYFENDSATNYYEKIDGALERRKFRIRTYTDQPGNNAPIFLEEKGRHNQRTFKNRVEITPAQLDSALSESDFWQLLDQFPDVSLIERFVFDVERRDLYPRVLVDYRRRPYVSDFDLNFRVTFDSRLNACPSSRLFPDGQTVLTECYAGFTIVEIKFFRKIPAWFHRILQVYDMRRLSISKFVVGMEKCNLAVDLS